MSVYIRGTQGNADVTHPGTWPPGGHTEKRVASFWDLLVLLQIEASISRGVGLAVGLDTTDRG